MWLAAKITGPVSGTRSVPCTRTSYRRRNSRRARRPQPAQHQRRRVGDVGAAGVLVVGHSRSSDAAASATTWSTTSSREYGVVSMWTAPSAIVSGAVARPESIRSRASSDSWVPGTSMRAGLGGAARGAGARVGGQVDLDLGLRPHDRPDVAALDDDPAVTDHRALDLEQPCPDLGHGAHRRHRGIHLVGADRDPDVDAVDQDRGAERVGAGQDLGLVAAVGHRGRVVDVDALAQQPPRHRPELGAGVEVAQPEPGSHGARRAGLAGAGRAVDGDHQVRAGVGSGGGHGA